LEHASGISARIRADEDCKTRRHRITTNTSVMVPGRAAGWVDCAAGRGNVGRPTGSIDSYEVLIAEDDLIASRVLEAALLKLGHEPLLAADGESAWQILQASPCARSSATGRCRGWTDWNFAGGSRPGREYIYSSC